MGLFRKEFDWDKWKQEHRWDALATYNGEVARGLVHTPEWKAKMAEEQKLFVEGLHQGYLARGYTRVGDVYIREVKDADSRERPSTEA